jgi:hypothetical protein
MTQWNSHKNAKEILHKTRINNSIVPVEAQKTLNSGGNEITDSKTYCRILTTEKIWHCHKNTHRTNETK